MDPFTSQVNKPPSFIIINNKEDYKAKEILNIKRN